MFSSDSRFDHFEAGRGEQLDEFDFVGGGQGALLVLQPVPRTDFNHSDTAREAGIEHSKILQIDQDGPALDLVTFFIA
jgi:hypothetical protein